MRSDDAYAYAWAHARRNADDSRTHEDLVRLVAASIDFDAEEAKLGKARRIIARRMRAGQTAAEGQVVFPGMEHYGYEPHRLLADDDGNLIQNERARMKYKAAEARRAQDDAKRAVDRATREQREHAHFSAWADEQYEAGRDPKEITWDTCVRETGLWKDADPEPAGTDPDDESEAAA
jgi:hypothetical protein